MKRAFAGTNAARSDIKTPLIVLSGRQNCINQSVIHIKAPTFYACQPVTEENQPPKIESERAIELAKI